MAEPCAKAIAWGKRCVARVKRGVHPGREHAGLYLGPPARPAVKRASRADAGFSSSSFL